MHVLFDSHGISEFGESEVYKAFEIVRATTAYAKVSLVIPARWVSEVPSLQASGVTVVPVDYDNRRFPGNNSLEYMYWLYSERAAEAVRGLIGTVDLVHRLNPLAVRYSSAHAFAGKPFVAGPIGWSRLPPAWACAPKAAARNALKTLDRVRLRSHFSRLHRTYSAASAIALGSRAALEAFPPELQAKCTVVGETVDTAEYSCKPEVDCGDPVVLYVGRLITYKGVEFLLDAITAIRDLPWRLRIVGDGPLEAVLKERAMRSGAAARIEFVGRIPRAEVRGEYERAAVCCFPGLNESTGNVNLEAMSCGRPVVAADWAGPRDFVTPSCGFRVPVGSPQELTQGLEHALRLLLSDPGLRRRLGTAARRRALEKFDTAVVMDRYRRLHLRACGRIA